MKKKTFFHISIILYFVIILFLCIIAGGVYVIIECLKSGMVNMSFFDWGGFVCAVAAIIAMLYLIFSIVCHRITLDEHEIYIHGLKIGKAGGMQYETHITYDEITNIYIISTKNNSLNESVRHSFVPLPYIIFDCKDETQKAVNVAAYSKRQVVKIIDEIILRSKVKGNELQLKTGTEILEEFMQAQNSNNTKH